MNYIYMLPAAFLAPVIHEWVKAVVSTAQGDTARRSQGFLTLNPFRYFEPIGFMFILLFGFGWGNPTPTTALHYRDRRLGVVITYMAPVLVNLLLGVAAVVGVNLLIRAHYGPVPYSTFFFFLNVPAITSNAYLISILLLANFALVNINLALFNLIPVYPLAANKLLLLFSRPENIARFTHYEKPMQIVLILFLAFQMIPRFLNPITGRIISLAWGLV